QVFPQEETFRDWVQGRGEIPPGIPELGVQYMLTGHVHLQDETVQVTVELLDRATGHRLPGTLTVDLPRLETLRTGFMALLEHAGLPVPASQQPKMLWPEDLSMTAFTLLGQGVHADVSALYQGGQAQIASQQFAEAWQRAPRSYLVLTTLGWLAY